MVFSIVMFKHFNFGQKCTVITNFKSITQLFAKIIIKTSPSLARISFCVLDYDFEIVYQ